MPLCSVETVEREVELPLRLQYITGPGPGPALGTWRLQQSWHTFSYGVNILRSSVRSAHFLESPLTTGPMGLPPFNAVLFQPLAQEYLRARGASRR